MMQTRSVRLLVGLAVAVGWVPFLGPVPALGQDSVRVSFSLPTTVRSPVPFGKDRFRWIRCPTFALALSGGGARGLAQIGVLQAFEKHGITPDFICGTSIGAIIGGLYAAGYTSAELKDLVKSIRWPELLTLNDKSVRSDYFVDQKPGLDRAILTIRFDGFRPVLPTAVSNGQRLTNLLNELTLQAPYRSTSFDELKIPFRAVSTDLYSGNRVVLSQGSLSEAIRASATIPVMYSAVSMDSMALVDGGLRSNIPVDVAKSAGCDLTIAVNTTSGQRTREQITNPLETLDQAFNILMGQTNDSQMRMADFVLTPRLEQYLATDFASVDSLIDRGFEAGEQFVERIMDNFHRYWERTLPPDPYPDARYAVRSNATSWREDSWQRSLHSYREVTQKIASLVATDRYDSLAISVLEGTPPAIEITVSERPFISAVTMNPSTVLPDRAFDTVLSRAAGLPCAPTVIRTICERVLRVYRDNGYSLARIDTAAVDRTTAELRLHITEGRIAAVTVEGNERTDPAYILDEFPLAAGDIFRIEDARNGVQNISGLNLFHRVSFDVLDTAQATITLRVEERPTRVLRSNLLVDNERNAQIGLEVRDDNLLGTGTQLAAYFFGGSQNRTYRLSYGTTRLFYTNLTFDAEGYYDLRDFNDFVDAPGVPATQYERAIVSTSRRVLYGARATAGLNVERFGNLFAALSVEQQDLRTIEFRTSDAASLSESQRVIGLTFGTTVDTQNKFPYPDEGLFLSFQYTAAQKALGSQVAFTRFNFSYDLFVPVLTNVLAVHPRIRFGYGDKTLPLTENFRIGGLSSFLGMRENEFTGRQMFTSGIEVRYRLPVQILFDSYGALRYDLGRTWEIPEQIKFSTLRHGAGLVLGLDTPIGPADFAVGKSFIFVRDGTGSSIRWGPTSLYFSIGVGME